MKPNETKTKPFDEAAAREALKHCSIDWYVKNFGDTRCAMLTVGEAEGGYSAADPEQLDRDELVALRTVIDHLIDVLDA